MTPIALGDLVAKQRLREETHLHTNSCQHRFVFELSHEALTRLKMIAFMSVSERQQGTSS